MVKGYHDFSTFVAGWDKIAVKNCKIAAPVPGINEAIGEIVEKFAKNNCFLFRQNSQHFLRF
jgi:hypothetical protein